MFRKLFVLGAAIIGVSASAGPALAAPFDTWAALASAQTTSPATAASGDQSLSWTAPDGRQVALVVKLPSAASAKTTITLPAVPADADARPYFEGALQQVKATNARALVLPKGTYTFQSLAAGQVGHLLLSGLKNVSIEGNGSTLVFTQNAPGIYLTQSQRLRLHDLNISYSLHTASTGTIVSQNGQNVLVIDAAYPVTAADAVGHLAQYNETTGSFVLGGLTIYTPPGSPIAPVYIGNQTYTSSAFQGGQYLNQTFMVFHHYYGGNAIQIQDTPSPGQSEDIVLDGVNIESGPGTGIFVYGVKRGLGIWNSSIAALPGALISTEYDAIQVLIAGGDVSLIGDTIANQGDDAINLNNAVSPVISTSGGGKRFVLSTYSRFMSLHDTLAFFDRMDNFLGTAEVVQAITPLGGPNNQYHQVVVSSAITGITTGSVVRDVNLINSRLYLSGNSISKCQCHGLLMQTPNTLAEDNVFSGTSGNAVRMLTNIGSFVEGVGAINDILSGNTISNTGSDAGVSGMDWSAISLYGVNANVTVNSGPVNKNVQILNNQISSSLQGCITLTSSEFVVVNGNTCTSTNLAGTALPGVDMTYDNNVDFEQNSRSGSTRSLFVNTLTTSNITTQPSF